jgi:hypothetical protein
MLAVLLLTLLVLVLVVWRAIDKATPTDVSDIVRAALAAIVTLVLTYAALRVMPPEAVPDLMYSVLTALRRA